MPSPPPEQNFYRWVDERGTVHVVSSLDAVPAGARTRLEEVSLRGKGSDTSAGSTLDYSSAAVGFGAGLLLVLVLPRGWKGVTRVAAMVAIGAILVGGYLATLRRSTGADTSSWLATPSAIVQDAKAAVQKANEAQRQRERELEEIRREGR